MGKYIVKYLIDVVSKNPSDYTIELDIEADSDIDAIKKAAISITRKDSSNIEWIENMEGDVKNIAYNLLELNYCFVELVYPNGTVLNLKRMIYNNTTIKKMTTDDYIKILKANIK